MWQRPRPARDKIFEIADLLRKQGIVPTTLNIRAKIGGSQTTVSKYLNEWRELYDCEEDFSPRKLQKQLTETTKINEALSAELLNVNQQKSAYLLEISDLKSRVLELETRLAERDLAEIEKIKNLQAINQTSVEAFANATEMMAIQLTAVNEQAIRKVQEVGQHFDENVIELRLEVRGLKEQVALKDREIKKLKEQLTDTTLKGRNYV